MFVRSIAKRKQKINENIRCFHTHYGFKKKKKNSTLIVNGS
jgi:hypothetical protein